MPDWLQNLLLAALGSTTLAGGVAWIAKTWLEGRRRHEERNDATRTALQARCDRLEAKVESLLMDAIGREKETNKHLQERIEMDARQSDVISAATQALKEATVTMAALKRPPP